MQAKYLNFTNGRKYLLTTWRIGTNDTINDYCSYFTASEVMNGITYNIPNACIGYVKDGVYHGFTGTLEDYDGNQYNISFTNGILRWTITLPNGRTDTQTYNHDCTLEFFSTASDSNGIYSIGIIATYPWTGGSYASVAPGSASGCFSIEASYLDFVDMYNNRLLNAQYLNPDGGIFGTRKGISSSDGNYLSIGIVSGNTSAGTSFRSDQGIDVSNSVTDYEPDDDPYNDPDEGTHSGGGGGNHDKTSDPIDFPPVPSFSASDTGFVTLYNPSLSQLRSLASYMWTGAFDVDNFKKLFADPMDAILGLSMVPVNVSTGSSQVVKVGNVSTGVSMNIANSQYVTVDCGSIDVKEYWGSYLDYEPYTKMEIFLPFIGMRTVSSDELMGTTVHIKYNVDILTGACVAFVKCANSVLYAFEGQCSTIIPISSTDWSATITAAVQAATAIGALVATGGASAALGAEAEGARAQMMAAKRTSQCITTGGSVVSSAMNAVKPQIQKSGGISGSGGMLGGKKPYLIITRPKQAVPGYQNKYQGYPSFVTTQLGALSGYTEVDSLINQTISASDTELAEIVSLLQGGVLL